MKPYLTSLIVAIFFFSCAEEAQNPTPTESSADTIVGQSDTLPVRVETIDTIPEVDTLVYDNRAEGLRSDVTEWLEEKDIVTLIEVMFFRDSIKTQEDLYRYYKEELPKVKEVLWRGMAKSNPEVEYSGDSAPAEHWHFIGEYIPEIYTACPCSECDSEGHIWIEKMEGLAMLTPGDEDNNYFEFCARVFGDGWGDRNKSAEFPTFDKYGVGFYVTDHCDICSYNTMGNGFYYETFTYALNHTWELYKEDVEQILDWGELGKYTRVFYYEKEEVLKELDQLLTLELPGGHADGVREVQTKIANNTDVYFGCQNWENDCPTP